MFHHEALSNNFCFSRVQHSQQHKPSPLHLLANRSKELYFCANCCSYLRSKSPFPFHISLPTQPPPSPQSISRFKLTSEKLSCLASAASESVVALQTQRVSVPRPLQRGLKTVLSVRVGLPLRWCFRMLVKQFVRTVLECGGEKGS